MTARVAWISFTVSGFQKAAPHPHQRLRPSRANARRISDWNSTMIASPRYGTMKASSARKASSPVQSASP